jgi:hypothetical protein
MIREGRRENFPKGIRFTNPCKCCLVAPCCEKRPSVIIRNNEVLEYNCGEIVKYVRWKKKILPTSIRVVRNMTIAFVLAVAILQFF